MLLLLDQPTPPAITSFAPSSGPVGSEIRIYGSGFAGLTGASVGGVALSGFVVISDSEVRGTIAAGTTTGRIVAGAATSTTDFVVVAGGGYTDEQARDDVGAALIAGNSGSNAITFALDDTGNTIKADLVAGGATTKLLYWDTATSKWEAASLASNFQVAGGIFGSSIPPTRLTSQERIPYTASGFLGAGQTYVNVASQPTALNDGYGGGGSGAGTNSLQVTGGNSFLVQLTWATACFVNSIAITLAAANRPAFCVLLGSDDPSDIIQIIALENNANQQIFSLLKTTKLGFTRDRLFLHFIGVPSGGTGVNVSEVGLYGSLTAPNLILHYRGEGANGSTAITDSSSNGLNTTGLITTTQFRFGSGSINASGSNFRMPTNTLLSMGTNNWTVRFWVRINNALNPNYNLFNQNLSFPNYEGITLGTGPSLNFFVNSTVIIGASYAFTVSTWHFVAVKREINTITLVAGSAAGATTVIGSANVAQTETFNFSNWICNGGPNSNTFASGQYDELQIWAGALDISQVPTTEF